MSQIACAQRAVRVPPEEGLASRTLHAHLAFSQIVMWLSIGPECSVGRTYTAE
jgi:hypothetical protein